MYPGFCGPEAAYESEVVQFGVADGFDSNDGLLPDRVCLCVFRNE